MLKPIPKIRVLLEDQIVPDWNVSVLDWNVSIPDWNLNVPTLVHFTVFDH